MNKGAENYTGKLNLSPLAVAVAVLTWTLPAITPYFMGLQILAPLPAFYFLAADGPPRGLRSIIAALLITGIITVAVGQPGGFLVTLLMLPAGMSLASETRKPSSDPVRAGFKACLVLLLGWLLWAMFFGLVQNQSAGFYAQIKASLDSGLVEVGKSLKSNSKLDPVEVQQVTATISRLRDYLPRVLPGLLLVAMLNTVFLNMVAGQWLLRRRKAELSPWPPLAQWRLPEPLVALVILAGISLLLPGMLSKTIGFNLLLVATTVYFFQGLAILVSYLNRWSVPPLLKILIFVLLMIQAYGLIILAAVGLIDVWADLRRRRPKTADKQD